MNTPTIVPAAETAQHLAGCDSELAEAITVLNEKIKTAQPNEDGNLELTVSIPDHNDRVRDGVGRALSDAGYTVLWVRQNPRNDLTTFEVAY